MLFTSPYFILLFLPLVVAGYFLLQEMDRTRTAHVFLLAACLVFYGWWDLRFVPLLAASVLVNFTIGQRLAAQEPRSASARPRLALGIALNLVLLATFKYLNFFIDTINGVTGAHLPLLHLVLPLGISFFTFTQIAFLVDAWEGKVPTYDFVNYGLFVTFFPHLIAGPIVHHAELMPQFARQALYRLDFENVARGAFIFSIGLFKKVVIADTLAPWADQGFAMHGPTFIVAWVTALSYTFQIYFDFSGYCDMAIGAALLFNIRLPTNFLSPYRALDIQEFWRRWHMTLSRFLRDYLYVPLGGNRRGEARTYRNLLVVFVLGGLWHGAAWTYVFWGFLHGAALAVHRMWRRLGLRWPVPIAWLLLFAFMTLTWVFFRAPTFAGAVDLLKGLVGLNGILLPAQLEPWLGFTASARVTFTGYWFPGIEWASGRFAFALLPVCLATVLVMPNSIALLDRFALRVRHGLATSLLLACSLALMHQPSPFLYYQF